MATPQCFGNVGNYTNPQVIVEQQNVAIPWLPCSQPNSTSPYVECCLAGDTCMTNNMCRAKVYGPGSSEYYISSTTDANWKDSTATAHCLGAGFNINLTYSGNSWGCCGFNSDGAADCSTVSTSWSNEPPPSELKVVGTAQSQVATATSPPTSSTPSSSSSATSTPTPTQSQSSSSGLSTGAKAGIGVGAAIGALLIIGLLVGGYMYFAKKRKGRASSLPQYATYPAAGPYTTHDAKVDPNDSSSGTWRVEAPDNQRQVEELDATTRKKRSQLAELEGDDAER